MNFHMYLNNFGEFYKDQIRNAKTLICTRCDLVDFNYEGDIIKQIAKINNNASIITAQLDDISFNELEDVLNIQYDKKNNITKAEKGVFKIHNLGKKVAHGVFQSWGIETNKLFKKFELQKSFEKISSFNEYGNILRGKGIVCIGDNNWMEFHYTPGFFKIEKCKPQKNSKIVVIGQDINKEKLEKLFA